jgi:hypothetical protein
MPIEEWWEMIEMGVLDAKQYIEQGLHETTMANRPTWFAECMKERKKKMGENYTRLEVNKWNDKFHFDRKTGVVLTYKDWQPKDSIWATRVDEEGNEVTDRHKQQEPVLSWWKTIGDAATYVFESFLLTFFWLQKIINNHGSKVSGLIAAAAMSLMTKPKLNSDLCLLNDYHGIYMQEELEWQMETTQEQDWIPVTPYSYAILSCWLKPYQGNTTRTQLSRS